MSDFEKSGFFGDSSSIETTLQETTSAKVTTTIDDFERLDGESIQREQHHHDNNEKNVEFDVGKTSDFDVDSLSSSPTDFHTHHHQAANVAAARNPSPQPQQSSLSLLDFNDDEKMFAQQNVELKSTDRPLVTLPGDPTAPISFDSSSLPETTEVNLTPDPDDKLGLDEPFVNVTGNLIGNVETKTTPSIYPGKLFNAQGFSINPTELLDDEEDDDGEIAEEEAEDDIRNLHYSPDVLHPSAPDLISNPYHRESEEEEESAFAELNRGGGGRGDSPPPGYESPTDDKYQYHGEFVEKSDYSTRIEEGKSSVKKMLQEETLIEKVEHVEKEIHISKIEELIEELTPPFAACPMAALPSKIELSSVKREEMSTSSACGHRCLFYPSAWFQADKIDPRVADLIYWRDVKKSGVGFGLGMVVLLSLTYFSLISVVAYLLLAIMTGTLSYRIYKNILQAVQKSSDGHPFKQLLDVDLSLSREKVSAVTDMLIVHLEGTAKSLRRLFLVEDLVDSLKFAVVLWCFTYIGSWFNGLTLVILAFVTIFTLPKVYETYKTQIDHYLSIACSQINDVVNKIKAMIPIGKKPKQQ